MNDKLKGQLDTTHQEKQTENPKGKIKKNEDQNSADENVQPALVDTAARKVLKDILTRILQGEK